MGGVRNLSALASYMHEGEEEECNAVFNVGGIQKKIASMSVAMNVFAVFKAEAEEKREQDIPILNTFQSSERHTDVTASDLSERWGISIAQATKTLEKTTQRFLRSAILPLVRRYRTDRVFTRRTLSGYWSCDTMDGRCKFLDGNKYAQVFANTSYFAKIYPMDSKSKTGDALRMFCQEFGVPEKLTFDGSREQTGKGTTFMKEVRKQGIDYNSSEPLLHNQNPYEGLIREIRR